MKLKKGVKLNGLKSEVMIAMIVADTIYKGLGVDFVLTSVCDGIHGKGSRHYSGQAFDCRTRDFGPGGAKKALKALKEALGAEFDIVLETNHIHVEWDPKR